MPNTTLLTDDEIHERRHRWRTFAASGDLFTRRYCGHWTRVVEKYPQFTIVEETNDGVEWTHPRLFAWTAASIERAYDLGVRLWGERWTDHADGPAYDALVQLALLGEVRYG